MTTPIDDATRERLTAPALRGFFRIADLWELTEAQQVRILGGSVDAPTLTAWRQTPPVSLGFDHLERMSYVLGIYEGLERIFRHAPEQSVRWLSKPGPEPLFEGRSLLEVMISDGVADLATVRGYIDGVNGGPPSRDTALQTARVAVTRSTVEETSADAGTPRTET